MFCKNTIKNLSIVITITLIISLMSAFVLPEKTRAEEQKATEVETVEQSAENIKSGEPEETTEEVTTAAETTTEETTTQEETTTKPVDPDAYEMVAHRGFSGYAPENSMPAFQQAIEADFDKIEFDIHRCKPDSKGHAEWIVSHDENLKRTTGVDKNIRDLTYDQIQKYTYNAGNNIAFYPNLKLVSLTQMIDLIKKTKESGKKIKWNLEIKTLDDNIMEKIDNNEITLSDFLYDEIVKPVEDAGIIDDVVFISFHYSYLKAIHTKNPSYPVWFLAKVLDDDYLDYARKCKAEGIIFKGNISTTSEQDIKNAISEGFIIGAYNTDGRIGMGSYYNIGVRSFTTNRIAPNSLSVQELKRKHSMKEFSYKISKRNYTFTNARKKPTLTITYQGEELLEGLSYEISYSNNKYPGTGTVTATGLRNCTGEKDKTFTIAMPKVKGFSVKKNNAKSLKYKWTANTDITGYKVYKYNYKTKKYVLVKTIKKNTTKTFIAKNLQTATKYRYRVKTYLTYKKKTYNSAACAGKTTYTKPDAEKTIKFKRSKKGKIAKIRIGKIARVTGYAVKISTDKNFATNVKTVTTKNPGKLRIKLLKKKKTYYAKARGYLKVGSKYYYGKYSVVVKKKGAKAKKKKKKKE